jgi:hypothetical protein
MGVMNRIRALDIGVESISRWQQRDEIHLPPDRGLRPTFLPLYRPLDEILNRPSLDERLPRLLQPEFLDPDLLEPATLTQVRIDTQRVLAAKARRESGSRKHVLETAAGYLDDAVSLDDEVRRSLAALLRG